MFGLILISDGENEGPLNNGSDIYCSACSPLVWHNLGLLHLVAAVRFCCHSNPTLSHMYMYACLSTVREEVSAVKRASDCPRYSDKL